MNSGEALPKSLENVKKVGIVNPAPGGARFTSIKRALRFVQQERAYFDGAGRLVFTACYLFKGRYRSQEFPLVNSFCGDDARPGRAVLPPSAEVLASLGTHGRPVRPPLRSAE